MHIPKIITKGIRIPHGPMEGVLALPCPCGEETVFDGERALYLTRSQLGELIFYHEGCIIHPGGSDDDA